MTHACIQRQLSAYLDGELPAEEMDRVRLHVSQCMLCREELARLQRVKTLLQRLPERPVPADLWTSIEARLARPAPSRAPWLGDLLRAPFRRPAMALGALAVLIVLVAIPLIRGHIEWIRAGSFGADVYVREHVLASSDDPFSDRAYLELLISDANLALIGTPREAPPEER